VMGSGVAVDWDSVEPVSSGTKPTADPVPYLTPECGPDAIGVWDVSETDPHLYALMEVGAAPADPTLPESAHAWFAGPEGVFMAHDVGGRAVRCYSLPPGIDTAPAAVDAMVRPPYPDAPAVALASSSSASKDWARYDPVFYVVTFYGGSGEGHASLPSLLWVNFAQRNRDRDVVLPVGPAGTTGRRLYRGVQGDYESAYWYPRLVVDIPDNTTTTFLDTVASASLGAIPPAGPDYLPYGIRHELYVYAVACCVDGGWGRLSPFSAKIATWSDYYSTGVIDVTVAPGPTGTTSRRVYRAAWPTGGAPPSPSDFHLISEVSGNEAAVVHDRMGEGSWGAAPPEVELTATEVITLSATGWTAGSWIDRIDTI